MKVSSKNRITSGLYATFLHVLCFYTVLGTIPALANPSGGQVVAGHAGIVESGSTLNVNQQSTKAIINWQDFSIGNGELTKFNQPSAQAVTLNRVVGGNESQILGQLQANGTVFLVNPNGVVFGSSAVVDVGGMVATTANISDQNFMGGNYIFDEAGLPGTSVINAGQINIADGGLLALVAPSVRNDGQIQAYLGKVSLASGNKFALDLFGDQLVNLAVSDKLNEALSVQVANSGQIQADGGVVMLQAADAAQVLDYAINMDGVIRAQSMANVNGKVVLQAASDGIVKINGGIDVSGDTGGTVHVLGEKVLLRNNANIDASGDNGGGEILIGGDYQGQGNIQTADITVVTDGASLKADARNAGDGGRVIVWADGTTRFGGYAGAEGGQISGDGGFIEISGKKNLQFIGDASTRAVNGQTGMLLLDPDNITVLGGAAGGTEDFELADNQILAADGPPLLFTITEAALEAIGGATNLTLQADDNIVFNAMSDGLLNLTNTQSVAFQAGTGLIGDISMNGNDKILFQGTDLLIQATNLGLGEIEAGSANATITLTANTGTVTLNGNLTTSGGNITVNGPSILGGATVITTGAGVGGNIDMDAIDGAQTLSLNAGTGNVIVGGNVGVGGADLTSFTANGTNLTLDSVTTTGAQSYTGALTTNGDFTSAGGNIDFNSALTLGTAAIVNTGGGGGNITFANTVNGGQTLTASAGTGNVVFSGVVGGVTPLTSVNATGTNISAQTMTAANNITLNGANTLNGNLTSNNTTVTLNGATTLAGNTVITSGGGAGDDITIGAINNDVDLTLNAGAGGNLSILQTDVNSLTLTGNQLTMNGNVTSDSALSFTNVGAITLAGNSVITADNGGPKQDITFDAANVIGGNFNLTLDGDTLAVHQVNGVNAVNMTGATAISLNNSVSSNGLQTYTGRTTLNNSLTTTNDAITFNNTLALTGDSIMNTGVGAGNITFANTVNGGQNLTTTAGTGAVAFNGVVGGVTPLTTLTSSGNTIALPAITTTGAQQYTGATTLNGDLNTTASLIRITGNSTLATGAIQLLSTGGNIDLLGTVNGGQAFTVNAGAGNINATGLMGGTTRLTSFDATGAAIGVLGVNTTGVQSYTGATTLNGASSTLNNNVTFNNTVALAGGSTVDTGVGAGNVTFANTLNGAQTFAVTAGTGAVAFNGIVGGVTPLTSLNATGNTIAAQAVTTNGLLSFTGTSTLNGDLTSNTGAVTLNGNVTLPANRIITSGGGAGDNITITGTVNDDRNLTLTAGAGNIAIANTDVNDLIMSGGQLTINGNITSDTALDFTNVNNIVLGANTVISADNGGPKQNITFDAANVITGNRNLTLDGDTLTVHQINGVNAVNMTGATAITLNNTVSSNGAQTYTGPITVTNNLTTTNDAITFNSPVTLTGDSIMNTGAGGGNITYNNTVNGAQNLTATAGTGNVIFNADVGVGTPLTSITASGNALTVARMESTGNQTYTGNSTLNGNPTSSTGAIAFNGDIALTGNRTITTGGGVGDDLTITGRTTGDFVLDLRAGLGNVAMGNGADIDTLTMTTGQQFSIGGDFLTDKPMDFTNFQNIVLTADTILTANDGGASPQDITFDAANLITGMFDLTISGDTVTLFGIGDNSNNPVDLSVTGQTKVTINADVFTKGNQIYSSIDGLGSDMFSNGGNITFNTPLVLLADVNVDTGAGPGNVLFQSTVDGPFNLNVNAGVGTVTAQQNIGDITPLTSFSIQSSAGASLQKVTTTGNQTYTGNVTLNDNLLTTNSDITFNSPVILANNIDFNTGAGAGNVAFRSTLDGMFNATFDTGTGNIEMDGDVGGITRLATLTVNNAKDFTMGGTTRVKEFIQTFGTGTTDFGTTAGLDSTGRISLDTTPNIFGRIFNGGSTVLRASNEVRTEVHVLSLTLAANTANVFGTIDGNTDRDAARLVDLETVTPGPYFMNGFSLPVVGDVVSPDVTFSADSFSTTGALHIDVNTYSGSDVLLDPFFEDHQLVFSGDTNRQAIAEYEQIEYLWAPVWEYKQFREAEEAQP